MSVVADAGPLIALAKLEVLPLLPQTYGPVMIPSAVYHEVVTRGLQAGHPDSHAVNAEIERGGILVVTQHDDDLTASVAALPLGRGERHAIELGLRQNAHLVLLDDLLAREAAAGLGLTVKGTLGVLADGYRRRLLSQAARDAVFATLLQRDDIWISQQLIQIVWKELRASD